MLLSLGHTIALLLALRPPFAQCVNLNAEIEAIKSRFEQQQSEFSTDRPQLLERVEEMQHLMYGRRDVLGQAEWPGLAKITRTLNKYVPVPDPRTFEKEMTRRERYYPKIMRDKPEAGKYVSEFQADMMKLGDWATQIRDQKSWEIFLPNGEKGYRSYLDKIDKWIWAWRKTLKLMTRVHEGTTTPFKQDALVVAENLSLLQRLKEATLNPRLAAIAEASRELPLIVASWFPSWDPFLSRLPFEVDDYIRSLTRDHGTKNNWWQSYLTELRQRAALDTRALAGGQARILRMKNDNELETDGLILALNRAKHFLFVRQSIESRILHRLVELLKTGLGTSATMLNQMGLGLEEKMTNLARISAHGQRGWKNRRDFKRLLHGSTIGYGINDLLSKLLDHRETDEIVKRKSMERKEKWVSEAARKFAANYKVNDDTLVDKSEEPIRDRKTPRPQLNPNGDMHIDHLG